MAAQRLPSSNILPSWRMTPTCQAIIDLIARTTAPGGSDYVPPAERLAVFDNDGTLWCEKPHYIQADFLFRRWRVMAAADPNLATTQPYKGALDHDFSLLAHYRDHLGALVAATAAAHAGITPEAFDREALAFFAEARHPHYERPYTEVIYQPMLELMAYLRANGFSVFIATAGGRDFVRAVAEQIYGLTREFVIGSSVRHVYRDGRLLREAELTLPIDDGPGKPVHLFERLGRAPLLAVGNSDGDYEMLEYARHGILLHHDDAEREYAYNAGTERALARAPQAGWTVVSMRDDWAAVWP